MRKNADRQTELVLENRQVLGLFFAIALLCGIFFALGYVVGRNTATPAATVAEADSGMTQPGEKPSAMPAPAYLPLKPGGALQNPESPAPETDLNFYQSVEEKQPQATLTSPGSPSTAPNNPATPAAEPPPSGILVQVSALSRREDAESLVQLLKEKKLPVLVTSGVNDSLFHVVVGPYKTDAEAERVRKLLEQEGFRPFVRH